MTSVGQDEDEKRHKVAPARMTRQLTLPADTLLKRDRTWLS